MGNQRLAVVQQLALERGRPVPKQLKTQLSERLVTFGASTARVLSTHWRGRDEGQAFVGPAWQHSGLVFTTPLAAGSTPTASVG